MDNGNNDKKRLKKQKQLVIKRILKFTDYKNC